MIVVKLLGGHSNQMFQYAVGRSLSLRHNVPLRLDKSWFANIDERDTHREYELGGYNIQARGYEPGILFKLGQRLGYIQTYNEHQFNFDPKVFELGPNAYLQGYFQSEKYFKQIRNQLLEDFTYINPPSPANAKLLQEIQADQQSVSLHIRRGDYVNNKHANAAHGVKDIAYYESALKMIKKQVKDPHLYVISNDPLWCKNNLKLKAEMEFVDNNDDITGGAEDMRLMRACRHNIMANSSFSWWGAWLNENPDKIVIAPKKWFNTTDKDVSDLIPKGWYKI